MTLLERPDSAGFRAGLSSHGCRTIFVFSNFFESLRNCQQTLLFGNLRNLNLKTSTLIPVNLIGNFARSIAHRSNGGLRSLKIAVVEGIGFFNEIETPIEFNRSDLQAETFSHNYHLTILKFQDQQLNYSICGIESIRYNLRRAHAKSRLSNSGVSEFVFSLRKEGESARVIYLIVD